MFLGNTTRRRLRDQSLHAPSIERSSQRFQHTSASKQRRVSDGLLAFWPELTRCVSWSSICRGATLWGLEHSKSEPTHRKTVIGRIARYSYGVAYSAIYDESKGHLLQDRRRGTKGEWRAINQMNWMLAKGDRVEEGKMLNIQLAANVQVSTLSTGTKLFSDELYYCADDEPPSRMELGEWTTLSLSKTPLLTEPQVSRNCVRSSTRSSAPNSRENRLTGILRLGRSGEMLFLTCSLASTTQRCISSWLTRTSLSVIQRLNTRRTSKWVACWHCTLSEQTLYCSLILVMTCRTSRQVDCPQRDLGGIHDLAAISAFPRSHPLVTVRSASKPVPVPTPAQLVHTDYSVVGLNLLDRHGCQR
jgi:hypothetical protein